MNKVYSIVIGPGSPEELADHVFGYDKTHELEFELSGDSVKAVFDKQHSKGALMTRIQKFVQTYVDDKQYNKDAEEHNAQIDSGGKKEDTLKKRKLVNELVDRDSTGGYCASVPEHLWFNLCADAMMASACMDKFAPGLNFSFVYLLEPLDNGLQWKKNYKLVIDEPDLGNDFALKIKYINQEGAEVTDTHKITITEVSDLEKITKSPVEQRQEAPAGTD